MSSIGYSHSELCDRIATHDPAHPNYRKRPPCPQCKGDCKMPCDECEGKGFYLVDGIKTKCTNRGCVDGLRDCGACDGSGEEN